MAEKLREIHLPEDLCKNVEQQLMRDFKSIDELLIFVLNELLRDDAAKLDEKEEQLIEDRLRDLGYI